MIKLERPLVFLDAESTGVNTEEDRIVELTLARFEPGEKAPPEIKSRLINPTIPIPPEATAVHGITDLDVENEPPFSAIASSLYHQLDTDVDFGGFNIVGFDLPILEAEFGRCGFAFRWQEACCIDGYAIMAQREPRDLAGALMFYCAITHTDAHRSEADVQAAIDVVAGQVNRYPDIEHTAEALDAAGRRPEWVDRRGKIMLGAEGELVFGFGKHYGKPIKGQVGYLRWMRDDAAFPIDTQAIIGEVIVAHEAGKQRQKELPS